MNRDGGRRMGRRKAPGDGSSGTAGGNGAVPTAPRGRAGPRLGQLLLQRGVVTSAQLSEALLKQVASGKRLGSLMVDLGFVNERVLIEVLAEQLGVPVVDLTREQLEPAAVGALPEAVARARCAIPVRHADGRLLVAVSDPLDQDAAAEIRREAKQPVTFALAPPVEIRRAIDSSYRALAGMERHVEAFTSTAATRRTETAQEGAADAPVVQAVNLIITQALRDRASDIHIDPQQERVRVRYRIDGVLHDVLTLPASMASPILSRIKIMADMNIVERRRPQDGQMTTELEGRSVDIRVATGPTIWGEKAALRVLDRSRSLFKLDELGMSNRTFEEYSRLLRSPIGMVVAAGPSGSGKTTTLYSTLREIDAVERNVTTIEDPVEYVFDSINQIPINEQAGINFASGLRSILRQDPDVILVGEIRDTETAQIAVQSALTGHFVLTTLHAQDAVSALHRFLDMRIEAFLIASSVLGVVGQRLLRRTCGNCRVPYQPPHDELAFYEQLGGPPDAEFSRGEGCTHCANTGYESRVGVYELLHVTDEIRQVLVDRGSLKDLRQVAVGRGMSTIQKESVRLVADGTTTIGEVARMIFNV